MLKLYKDWYLDADPHQYILGKLTERKRDGNTVQEMERPTCHPTIAAAVNYVLEAEMRKKVAGGELIDLATAMAFYETCADDLLAEIESIPGNLKKAVTKRER